MEAVTVAPADSLVQNLLEVAVAEQAVIPEQVETVVM
jgi:hypothetical protein